MSFEPGGEREDACLENGDLNPSLSNQSAEQFVASTGSTKAHFARNTLSNVVYFFFNSATSFLMVPYAIHYLGVANYGMVALANSFVSYTQVFTIMLVSSLFRFVTAHLAQGNTDKAKTYFDTQVVSITWFTAVFLPLACLLSYYTPAFLNIPHGQAVNTRMLFLAMYGAFFATLLSNPFKLAQFVTQRFYLGQWIDIAGQTLRYSTWVLFFSLTVPAMWHVGLGYLLGAAFSLAASAVVSRKLMPQFRPSLRGFNKAAFVEMTKMGGWMTVDQIGTFLALSIDVLVINRMIGPESVGKYSAILGLSIMLRSLSSAMSGIMTPLSVSAYASGDHDALTRHITRAVRMVSLGAAVPLGIACGLAVPFLTWWLGPSFASLYPLVWLLLGYMVITCGVEPMFGVSLGANRMAAPAIVDLCSGLVKLALAIVLIKYTRLGMYGAAVATAVVFVAKYGGFTPWYTAHILERNSWVFYRSLLPAILVFPLVAACALLCTHAFLLTGLLRLALAAIAVTMLACLGIYRIVLDPRDRAFLKSVGTWSKHRS